MIHVEQKKILKKQGKNLAKATNENRISINASNNASKNSNVKKMRLPIKKQSKQRLL